VEQGVIDQTVPLTNNLKYSKLIEKYTNEKRLKCLGILLSVNNVSKVKIY
jgi:hypothetical protein